MTITESPDGGFTLSENTGTMTIDYTGTWTGSSFQASGSYSQSQSGDTLTTDSTIDGTFTGCSNFTATWVDNTSDTDGICSCTLTWSLSGTLL
jgi:hypothetical protein